MRTDRKAGKAVSKERSTKVEKRPPIGRPKGNTAPRILEAAKDLIARDGVDALRLATIGARLGISSPAIYAHFPGGRGELINQVALEGLNGMNAFFPHTGGAVLDELLSGISGLVSFYVENRAFMRIMLLDFSSPDGHPSVTREIGRPRQFADGAFRAMHDRLDKILKSLAASGNARPVPANILLNLMLGATTLNLIYPPAPRRQDRNIADTVESIVRDMACRYLGIADDSFTNSARNRRT